MMELSTGETLDLIHAIRFLQARSNMTTDEGDKWEKLKTKLLEPYDQDIFEDLMGWGQKELARHIMDNMPFDEKMAWIKDNYGEDDEQTVCA